MSAFIAIILFLVGVVLAIWATERLLEGLVSLASILRFSAFAVGAVLSGFEAENIAVGLASGSTGVAPVALGTVFGGAIFLVCMALGIGVILFPLKVRLPRGFLLLFAACPMVTGLGLIAPVTPRWVGIVFLAAFFAAMTYIVLASRHEEFLASDEVAEAQEEQRSLGLAVLLTIGGIVVISIAGELVARGAEGIISALGVPALLMGMIVTPAAIEIEEVARQAIPSKKGRHDISAGNLIGTLLYFLWFNFGLIVLITPVRVDPVVRELDWPTLIVVTWIAAAFLWRGRVGRGVGVLLVAVYVAYIVLHVVLR